MTSTSAVLLRLWQRQSRYAAWFPGGFNPPDEEGRIEWTAHLVPTPFLGVQDLWLGGEPLGAWQGWHVLFSQMHALRRLVLDLSETDSRNESNVWLNALSADHTPLGAPALRELECHGLPLSQSAVDLLLRLVRDRQRLGQQLSLLRVLPNIDADRRDPIERLEMKGVRTVDDWGATSANLRVHVVRYDEDGALRVPPPQLPEIHKLCPEFNSRPYS